MYTCLAQGDHLLNPQEGVTRSDVFGGQEVRYSLSNLWGGPDEQVEQTIAKMLQYAVEDSKTPEIREDARVALELGGGDPVLGVWKLCKQRFRFQQDVDTVRGTGLSQRVKDRIIEVIIRPLDLSLMYRRSLQPVEDCDGYTGYMASLLLALGVACNFCAVACDPGDPSQYTHVYVVVYRDGARIAVDASHGKWCGWEVPNPYGKRKEWEVQEVPVVGYLLLAALVGALVWGCLKGE